MYFPPLLTKQILSILKELILMVTSLEQSSLTSESGSNLPIIFHSTIYLYYYGMHKSYNITFIWVMPLWPIISSKALSNQQLNEKAHLRGKAKDNQIYIIILITLQANKMKCRTFLFVKSSKLYQTTGEITGFPSSYLVTALSYY